MRKLHPIAHRLPCIPAKVGFQSSLFVVLVWFFISSCGEKDAWTEKPDPVAAGRIEFIDLHQIVRQVPADTVQAIAWFQQAAGTFAQDYTLAVLPLGASDSSSTYAEMHRFIENPQIVEYFGAIDSISAPFAKEVEPVLREAWGRFSATFPKDTLPKVVWMNSAFNFSIFPTKSHVGVGLDWYLGADHPIVDRLAPEVFPNYQKQRMDPEFLVTDILRGWMLMYFADAYYAPKTCADEALYRGKIYFMLHRIHPDAASRLWWDWTEEQWAWAEEHEREVWQEFSNAKELLSERRTDYLRWFNEGPFTRAGRIPQESPDQLGTYIAWRAVEDYMAAHPETTLPELLALRDPVPVFKAYRP
jgi:hypothetical protein